MEKPVEINLNVLADICHADNEKWWYDLDSGARLNRNFGELIALCHSELSEALEGDRKSLMDDKLPHRKSVEVELADCLIRIFDLAGAYNMDLDGAFWEKRAYNKTRIDHTHEHRKGQNGKKY